MLRLLYRSFRFIRFFWRCVLFLFIRCKHLIDRVEGPRAVVPHEHRRASEVALGQNLRAAAAAAFAIEEANLIVTQLPTSAFTARGLNILRGEREQSRLIALQDIILTRRLPARRVAPRAVVCKDRQAAIVRERDERAAAA